MSSKKYYVTTPIYYVNSKPHIGHAYTTVVADILARYHRFKFGEKKVWFLTGTDEHGSKVAQSAEKAKQTPLQFATEVSLHFRDAWKNLNISNNDFIRTTETRHEHVVEEVLLQLKKAKTPKGNDFIYKGSYEGLYCVGCEAYKKETDLVDGMCVDHHCVPVLLKEDNWYFRLSDYVDVLKEVIIANKLNVFPQERRNEVESFLNQGLEDVAISRQNVKWGIPVPWDVQQTVYVWVDALINYISALGYPDGKAFWKFWPADLQLLGKDILKFHCLIWPAMLLALDIDLPKALFVHGFFTIDGKKISKTLGNVIDPNDLVNEFGVDGARYLIVSQFAFGQDGDIKANEFVTKYNADLANGLGNLVSRVLAMAEKYCGGKVPKKRFGQVIDLSKTWQAVDDNYSQFKIFENVKEIWSVIKWCDGYIDEKKPWAMDKEGRHDEVNQIIYNLLEIIRNIGWWVKPLMPETGAKILACLNEKDRKFAKAQKKALKPGTTLQKCEGLFPRK
ncbi:MAG: methionine--tRNA ligase [Parcubacteria group bacterium]